MAGVREVGGGKYRQLYLNNNRKKERQGGREGGRKKKRRQAGRKPGSKGRAEVGQRSYGLCKGVTKVTRNSSK